MAVTNTTQGAGAWLALGEETTEGTSVTVDVFGAFRSANVRATFPREIVEPLGAPGLAIPAASDVYITAHNVAGDITTTARYDDQLTLVLMKHLFGSVATAGANPYTYTYTATRAKPTKPSFTLELVRGTGGTLDRAETFAGCRVSQLVLSASTGGLVECAWSLLGVATEGIATETSPTFETGRHIATHDHVTSVVFNGGTFEEVMSVQLTINKSLSPTPKLGSLTSSPMQMTGLFECTLVVRHRYTVNTQHTAYQAGTQGTGSVTITDGTRSMVFSFVKLDVDDHQADVTGPGLVEATTTFRALATTSAPVSLVITNTVAP